MKAPWLALFAALTAGWWLGCAGVAAAAPIPTYLAIGDSLAYGMQIGHLKQEIRAGKVSAATFDTGYANRLADKLRASTPGLRLIDLGCPGETTSSFIHGPCAFATDGKPFGHTPLPMHVAYRGAQLKAALGYLASPRYDVRLVTLDIGINDLRAGELQCAKAAHFDACLAPKWEASRARVARNLDTILQRLRQAAPHTPIAVLTYYNWLALQHPGSNRQVHELNALIEHSAHAVHAKVIRVFPQFDEQGKLCELSLVCGPTKDLHPTNTGYELIARRIYAKVG